MRVGLRRENSIFSGAIADAGDLTQDGRDEIAVGANGPNQADVVLVVSQADLAVIRAIEKATMTDHGRSGMAGIGDVEGDAVPDMVVSSSGWGVSRGSHGRQISGFGEEAWGLVRVHSGTNGSVLAEHRGGSHFASQLVRVGDLDRDGVADHVVTAGWFSMDETWVDRGLSAFSTRTGRHIWTCLLPPGMGSMNARLVAIQDVDGDGYGDLILGVPSGQADVPSQGRGAAVVISGADGRVLREHRGQGPASVGISAVEVSDLDGDGLGDYAIGEGLLVGAGPGRVRVYSGAAGCELISLEDPDGSSGFGFALAFVCLRRVSVGSRWERRRRPPRWGRVRSMSTRGETRSPLVHLSDPSPARGAGSKG